jgi:3-oxoacid CoA-transferase subunit B
VIVAMTHTDRKGNPKLLKECDLPLTGKKCINKVVTDLAVIEISDGKFHLKELAPDVSLAEVIEKTGAELQVPDHLR